MQFNFIYISIHTGQNDLGQQQKRILIVEDDELVLESLNTFLTEERYSTATAKSAEEVGAAILDFEPELIIMDIRLGTSDGRIMCDQLKSEKDTAHISIILLTAISHNEIAQIDCEADAIMGKPYEAASLLYTIRQLMPR